MPVLFAFEGTGIPTYLHIPASLYFPASLPPSLLRLPAVYLPMDGWKDGRTLGWVDR